ncbi:MAG: MlaD family protein [Verrucomicrobiota bacterium]
MSEQDPITPPAATPELRAAQRWNIVWVVPILALLIGGWMIWKNFTSQGPVARVRFETAEGIEAGKTAIKCRSVRVGVVKRVVLDKDLSSVLVYLELDPDYDQLLRRGTQFWVVRPRVSGTEVTGLGTLLQGAYIELDPGKPEGEAKTLFKGRETPPATNRNIPGRRLTLTAEKAGSLVAGSPIYYRGFEIGRIEGRTLDIETQRVIFNAFIRAEYSTLVKTNSRFWNTSGIDISAGADGFKVRTPSFQAMVSGGASFGVPEGEPPGEPATDGTAFTLYSNEDEANGSSFNPSMKFLLLFDQSVRGLSKSAPVEFKGIPIGRVADISFDYLLSNNDSRIPVLVEIDPSLLRRDMAEMAGEPDMDFIASAVKRGLRATLKPGSLITGALFVDVNYYPDVAPAELGKVGELITIPTVPGGLENMITAFLEKLQSLPLEETMTKFGATAEEASAALVEIKQTAASTRKMLESSEFTQLPADLRASLAAFEKLSATFDKSVASYGPEGPVQGDMLRTLDELRAALRNLSSLTKSIDEKPNSLLFGRDSSGNPIPRAPRVHR